MSGIGLVLIAIAAIAFVLVKPRHGLSRLGDHPLLVSMLAAVIAGLIAAGVIMTLAGLASGELLVSGQ
jgi:hypothetical protein